MTIRPAIAFFGLGLAALHGAEEGLDNASKFLTVSVPEVSLHARLSGSANLEFYHGHQSSSGFVFTEGENLFNPKLILFLDTQVGRHLYAFAQARVDRGFDPSSEGLRFRLDEYAIRFAPANNGRFNLQVGQFAGVIGTWVGRHDPWDNPFVGAPMVYETLTNVDEVRAATSFDDLMESSEKDEYQHAPILWGPSYATGAAVSGRIGFFEYAGEIKNTGPSAVPEAWPIHAVGFEHPAFNSRIGFLTTKGWKFGFSYSDSVYLLPAGEKTMPAGFHRSDYRERLWAQDVSFAWHRLQLWAELFEARFNIPRVGEARTVSGYVETRYKFTPQFYGALRWNQQVFSRLPNGSGGQERWGNNVSRLDAAAVYRLTAHAQIKFQTTVRSGSPEERGPIFGYATQFTLRF